MRKIYRHSNESRWYVTSDVHFDHSDILKHNPFSRPFQTLDQMHECIVERWNAIVRKNDFVVIVGDFAFKNVEKWATALRGHKYLILGDHDSVNQECRTHFLKVCEGLRKTIMNRRFYFHHYPCLSWPDKYEGSSMIHGHSHGRLEESESDRRIDVSMDAWDLRVIPIEVIFDKLDAKKPMPPLTQEEWEQKEVGKKELVRKNLNLLAKYDKMIEKETGNE